MTIELTPQTGRQPITRDLILDNASVLLQENGVSGFRLKDLAERLNVTIPNLYRYFADREAIIQATYVRTQGWDAEFLCAALKAVSEALTPGSDFTNTIAEFWPMLLTEATHEQRNVRFRALAALHDGAHHLEPPGSINEVHAATTQLFRQAQVHGLIDASINPEALSLCIRSMILGMVLRDFGDNVHVSDDELTALTTRFYKSVVAK
jgi:AcrR family transcriptional regulator